MGNSYSCQLDSADGRVLLSAAEAGNSPQVGLFLFQDVNYLRYRSSFGRNTVWHKASKAGKLPVLKSMANVVSRQFDPTKDIDSAAAMLLRMGASPKEVMEKLVNSSNSRGYTPLMLACRGGHAEVATFLLAQGADAFRKERVRRHTALHFAAEGGHLDCVRVLLNAVGQAVNRHQKKLIDVGNHAGLTALHYAVYCDQPECMKLLISMDANINAQADFADLDWAHVNAGDTPMHLAAARGNIEAIRILLKSHQEMGGTMVPTATTPVLRRERRFRDPRAFRNDYGRLPYHVAVRKGHTYLMEMLDPSVPVRYLLSGEELDVSGAYGPPRLAVLAAAALHTKLLRDLESIKAEMAHRAEAALAGDATPKGGAAATAGTAGAAGAAAVTGEQNALDCCAAGAGASSAAAAGAGNANGDAAAGTSAAAAATAAAGRPGHRRSWSWGSRRSASLQEIGFRLRLNTGHNREGLDEDGGSTDATNTAASALVGPRTPPASHWAADGHLAVTREASDETGALVCDAFLAASAAAVADGGAGSSGAAAVVPPACSSPSELLHFADGAVSVLLRALPGRRQSLQRDSNTGNNDNTPAAAAAPAAAPAPAALSPRDSDATVTAVTPTNRSVTSRSWRSPRISLERLTPPRSSSRVTSPRASGFGSSMFSVFASSQAQQQQPQPSQEHSADDAIPSGTNEQAESSSGFGAARTLQRCFSSPEAHGSSSGGGCEASTSVGGGEAVEKVSPNPELLLEGNADTPSSLLGAVLKPFRRSSRVVPVFSSAMSCGASDIDDAETCGVCLDCRPNAMISPCQHQMCAECAVDMCKRYSMASAVCPFCRAVVAGFSMAPAR